MEALVLHGAPGKLEVVRHDVYIQDAGEDARPDNTVYTAVARDTMIHVVIQDPCGHMAAVVGVGGRRGLIRLMALIDQLTPAVITIVATRCGAPVDIPLTDSALNGFDELFSRQLRAQRAVLKTRT